MAQRIKLGFVLFLILQDASNDTTEHIPRWQEKLLCHYTLDRLFSFSILTARVFAVGDPAGHAVGPTQKCM